MKDLDASYRLHGAANHAELNQIVRALCAIGGDYDRIAAATGVDRAKVVSVATWYQSLWLRP